MVYGLKRRVGCEQDVGLPAVHGWSFRLCVGRTPGTIRLLTRVEGEELQTVKATGGARRPGRSNCCTERSKGHDRVDTVVSRRQRGFEQIIFCREG